MPGTAAAVGMGSSVFTGANLSPTASAAFTNIPSSIFPISITGGPASVVAWFNGHFGVTGPAGPPIQNVAEVRVVINGDPGPYVRVSTPSGGVQQNLFNGVPAQHAVVLGTGTYTMGVQWRAATGNRRMGLSGHLLATVMQGVPGPTGAIGPLGPTGPAGAGTMIGSGIFQIGDGVPLVEAASVGGRRYAVLALGTAFSGSFIPSGLADRAVFIANAASPPATFPGPTGGILVWSQQSGPHSALFGLSSSGRITTIVPAKRLSRSQIDLDLRRSAEGLFAHITRRPPRGDR